MGNTVSPGGIHHNQSCWSTKPTHGPPARRDHQLQGTVWFCDATPCSLTEFQFLAARWSRCFQLRQQASGTSVHLWSATYPSPRLQHLTLEAVLDLLVTVSVLPPMRYHMGFRVSPFILATGASEPGFGVVRSSTFTLEGSIRVSQRELSTAVAWEQLGITELHDGIGGLQRSVKLLERVPGVTAAGNDATCIRMLAMAWPAAVRLPQEDELFHHFGRNANLVRSAAPYLFHVRPLQVGPGAS